MGSNLPLSISIVIFTVLVVLYLDSRKVGWINKVLDWIPAILFAYVVPAVITHLFHLDLSSGTIHSWSKSFIMPFAIVTVMSALSVQQLKRIGLRPIVLFVSGSFAIAILPFILFILFKSLLPNLEATLVAEEYWKGLVTVVGSWIGGSTSQLVLKEVVECPENVFLTILIMDNILVNIWTIIMFQFIKKSENWNRFFGINDKVIDFVPDVISADSKSRLGDFITFGLSILAVILTYFLPIPFLAKVVILSLLGLGFGNFISVWNHALVLRIGGIFIILIMAILGLKLQFDNLSMPASVILFAIIWLILHYVVMIGMAKLLNLNMAWVPIASMANVGGISTAPAVTKAFNEEWMPHAILLAILSMVTGTFWGLLTIYLFKFFLA